MLRSDPPSATNNFYAPHTDLLCDSFHRALGRPLFNGTAAALFDAAPVILSHDGTNDPRLTYANKSALQLWETTWDTLIGMPSRLTAEPAERAQRDAMFTQMRTQGYIENYSGIRISAKGNRFEISGAIIWPLIDAQGIKRGEAATFTKVRPLPLPQTKRPL